MHRCFTLLSVYIQLTVTSILLSNSILRRQVTKNMTRSFIWLRSEIFQLVTPSFSQCGRNLTHALMLDVLKQIARIQSSDHMISFDRWITLAKEYLKWNDNVLKLFWEMLSVATYTQSQEPWRRHKESMCAEHLSLFLILHIQESTSRQSSPSIGYDTMWPVNDLEISSPTSPSSPSSIKNNKYYTINNTSSHLNSPKSPRSNANTLPNSPSRSMLINSRQSSKSPSHHLLSIRHQLPLILCAISSDDFNFGLENLRLCDLEMYTKSKNNFLLSSHAINCLGLIFAGGMSKEKEISPLSSIYPNSTSTSSISNSSSNITSHPKSSSDLWPTSFPFSEVCQWLESSLCINEAVYPSPSISSATSSPIYGSITATQLENDFSENTSTILSQRSAPQREILPLSSLARNRPLLLTGFTSTYVHIVTTTGKLANVKKYGRNSSYIGDEDDEQQQEHEQLDTEEELELSEQPSLSKKGGARVLAFEKEIPIASSNILKGDRGSSGSSNIDFPCDNRREKGPPVPGEGMEEQSHRYSFSPDSSATDNSSSAMSSGAALNIHSTDLPHVTLQGCSRATLYLLSPFASASLFSCSDCTIVLSGVAGVVLLSSCERIQITVACPKVILRNCLDCDMRIATLTATLISGDSRGLTFAPYNCSFKHLEIHLQLARLTPVLLPTMNRWSTFCDLTACIESPPSSSCSPTGYAIDLAGDMADGVTLPFPLESVAMTLAPEKFSFISVPIIGEHLPAKDCVIVPPIEYLTPLQITTRTISDIRTRLRETIPSTTTTTTTATGTESGNATTTNEEEDDEEIFQKETEIAARLSKHFLDWLTVTGKAQHILDLISIDAELAAKQSG